MSDIIETLDPSGIRNETDFYQDLRYAKKIFENLESSLFPGKYYEKKKS